MFNLLLNFLTDFKYSYFFSARQVKKNLKNHNVKIKHGDLIQIDTKFMNI